MISTEEVCLIALAILSYHSIAQNLPQDFLDVHNIVRTQVDVGFLTWKSTLAGYAQSYANQRMNDCNLVFSNGSYGENISVGYGRSGVDAVWIWASGKHDYDYFSNSCRNKSKLCLTYTQVVWGNTTRLGCARVECMNMINFWFIICEYDPPGNIPGQRPY